MSDILDIKRRRLTLVGDVNEDMLRQILVAFDVLEQRSKTKPVRIILSTVGGEAYPSLGIYDRIKSSPCPVIIECFGEIMSAGTIILQAANLRLLHKNVRYMIHYGSTGAGVESNARDAQSQLEFEKTVDNPFIENLYLNRCKKRMTLHQIKRYLSVDSYFTAERAVELGLADKVIQPRKK